ncbi:HK97 gp10 family phage protein [Streptomyces sp. NPDC047097]|uniref:HK97 gp10 family phage protein n=1 Tax=Streptomyces sp. NPDC047097 TaxID=3155260 RepID=UPI0033D21887
MRDPKIVVELDEEAIAGLVLDEAVQADLAARMDRVVDVAKATAPVDTGEFRDNIHRIATPDTDGTIHVDADAEHSVYVELGTRQTDRTGRLIHPARHTLGHALDAAGGDHDA